MPKAVSKKGWQTYRFDEMATMVNDRIDDPSEADVEYYVGLEHLDSDSLTVRRWGTPSDVEATKLRFRAGDIIFGRRRVYQRKLAVAHFDGICSAHAMVLRAKPKVVLPEFLPFFMQSDLFMERAKEISVGSLSPTINWKTLANEEFVLPPLEEQRRIASALTATRNAQESYVRACSSLAASMQALIADILNQLQGATLVSMLQDHADIKYGLTVNPERRKVTEQIPYLRVANVLRGMFDLTEIKTVGKSQDDDAYRLARGDVLVVEGHADVAQIGRAAVWRDEIPEMFHQNHLIRIRCDDSLDPEYLCLLVNSLHGRSYFHSHAKSSSGLNTINSTVVKQYSIPVPSRDTRSSVVEKASMGTRLMEEISKRQDDLTRIRRTILSSIESS